MRTVYLYAKLQTGAEIVQRVVITGETDLEVVARELLGPLPPMVEWRWVSEKEGQGIELEIVRLHWPKLHEAWAHGLVGPVFTDFN